MKKLRARERERDSEIKKGADPLELKKEEMKDEIEGERERERERDSKIKKGADLLELKKEEMKDEEE
jgi:hypothetical protein